MKNTRIQKETELKTELKTENLTENVITVTFPKDTDVETIVSNMDYFEKSDSNHTYIAIADGIEMYPRKDLSLFFKYLEKKLNLKITWKKK